MLSLSFSSHKSLWRSRASFVKSKVYTCKPISLTYKSTILDSTKRRSHVSLQSLPIDTVSYFIGKSIILFTLFYCTLNWSYYRRLRKDHEDDNPKP
jgi:hypothetical protein